MWQLHLGCRKGRLAEVAVQDAAFRGRPPRYEFKGLVGEPGIDSSKERRASDGRKWQLTSMPSNQRVVPKMEEV